MIFKSLAVMALFGVEATNKKTNLLMDKTLVSSKNQLVTSPVVTNEARPLDEKRGSDALYKGD
jgi:hypothetical protein